MNPHPNQESLLREPVSAPAQDESFGSGREVKNLAAQSKKTLAREILRLRALLQALKGTAQGMASAAVANQFQHREAFALMAYIQRGAPEGEAAEVIHIWNSRDGVTPFIVHIGAKSYEHDIKSMSRPHFDLPATATHKWETRTDAKMMEAFGRTLDLAVKLGRIEPTKADDIRGNAEVAESWNYRIGLRDLSTGNYTDEDQLRDPGPKVTEAAANA
ncbi:hypothetical protein P9A48_gp78 [Xanthomonas phage Mallos]|uniref:Uncharacterized protein n=1 Tax=Xanthomonas phage Mallos TaxID=2939131 RepID=A0A9E7E238_9CAUD|nr:hypothetical protein P9A48_gp78 [Xanthomonas phage Mallos]URA07186.1 hypothetical protein Mallos_BL60078 [Xanthomonas phage Mallos]